jgi:hypothetical protein
MSYYEESLDDHTNPPANPDLPVAAPAGPTLQRRPSYELFDAYGDRKKQPVLQRLPWLRVTPPVTPAASVRVSSPVEYGIISK